MVKDQKKLMENGDMFGLLRDRLFFKVMYDVPNGSIKRYLNKQKQTFKFLPEHCFIPEFTHFSHVIWILSEPLILPVQTINR